MKHLKESLAKLNREAVNTLRLEGKKSRTIKRNDGTSYRGKIDSSGSLGKSLKAFLRGSTAYIEGNNRLDFWDQGVSGTKHKAKGSKYKRTKAPKPQSLLKWMSKKGIGDEKTKDGIAYAIGQKIKERGTPKTGILTQTIESLLVEKEDILYDGMDKEIDQLLDF